MSDLIRYTDAVDATVWAPTANEYYGSVPEGRGLVVGDENATYGFIVTETPGPSILAHVEASTLVASQVLPPYFVGLEQCSLGLSACFEAKDTSLTRENISPLDRELRFIRVFLCRDIPTPVELWLRTSGYARLVARTVRRLYELFEGSGIALDGNRNGRDRPAVRISVYPSSSVDDPHALLDRFDDDFWLRQRADARMKILINTK